MADGTEGAQAPGRTGSIIDRLPAPERDPHWTGVAIGATGVTVNVRLPEGSAEFVFAAEDLDDVREEGRDLLVARVPAEDLLDLRRSLNAYLPSDPIGPATVRMRERVAAVFHEWRRQRDGLPPWREVQPGSGCYLYAMACASEILATLGVRDETLPTGAAS